MRRTWPFCALIVLCPLLALGVWRARAAKSVPAEPAEQKLPLTQVVLFNTGLGYFQREGTVEGDVRVDLQVPGADVNDLLKTLLVDNAGKRASVSFDGAEPVEQKLRSFGLDLVGNPTLGQLLNLARGEKVEVALESAVAGVAGPLTGVIVGMEAQFENQVKEVHHLNLLCADGVRRLPLERVARVRFLDPVLENEFRRALAALATGRTDQRRQISVSLPGRGNRKVKIGHVAETPIWKASYRLALGGKGPSLQGWAVVENTSDEDWRDVRVVLVSGRPITFKMDLSQQLYVPRPTVEPEVYASLRPPSPAAPPVAGSGVQIGGFNFSGGVNLGAGGGALGALGGALGGGMGLGSVRMNPHVRMNPLDDEKEDKAGRGGPGAGPSFNRYQPLFVPDGPSRLTYEDLIARRKEQLKNRAASARQALEAGSALADLGNGIDDVVTNADKIGEGFRYTLEPRVNLPRQKSSLLPTLESPVELKRVSLFNSGVHPRFPLLAVRFKNSTGQHLMQGPLAVYDDGHYAGDSRLPDLQPGQERLMSYAVDLGVEIRPEGKRTSDGIVGGEIVKGSLRTRTREHLMTVYTLRNRARADRVLLVEHPITTWKLSDAVKPLESTEKVHRFEWKVAAGKIDRRAVSETRTTDTDVGLAGVTEEGMAAVFASDRISKAVKEALRKVLAWRKRLDGLHAEVEQVAQEVSTVKNDQQRIRGNMLQLSNTVPAYKRFAQKFEDQETQIEKLEVQLSQKRVADTKERTEFAEHLKGLNVK